MLDVLADFCPVFWDVPGFSNVPQTRHRVAFSLTWVPHVGHTFLLVLGLLIVIIAGLYQFQRNFL